MVTIDAMGTQTTMAVEQDGDAALALTDHQGNCDDEGKATVALAENDHFHHVEDESDHTVDNDHGRLDKQ